MVEPMEATGVKNKVGEEKKSVQIFIKRKIAD